MLVPSTLADIERMIRDKIQESIHLDYKASAALNAEKPQEIAKDVSSFANSDGGVLIYGVEERDHFPVRIDDGVDPAHCPKERLEDIITGNITPRLDDVRITPLPLPTARMIYVVQIEKSFRGPHQASDHRYYKRHNFKSSSMEDYEIRDVRNRRRRVPSLVSFELTDYRHFIAAFDVANIGDTTAEDVRVDFSPEIPWPDGEAPEFFVNGLKRMAPGQRLRFRYFSHPEILGENSRVPGEFTALTSYFNPEVGSRIVDEWFINFHAHRGSMYIRPEMEIEVEEGVKHLRDLLKSMEKLTATLAEFKALIGATGLDLSVSTLRNLKRVVVEGERPEPLRVAHWDPAVFVEVLGVDYQMAYKLSRLFDPGLHADKLRELPGITDELMALIREWFVFPPEPDTEEGTHPEEQA